MSEDPPLTIPYFAVTHKPIAWPMPDFITIIGGGPDIPEGCIDLTKIFPETRGLSRSLSEARQLFALRRLLEARDEQGMVGIGTYRRLATCVAELSQLDAGGYQVVHPDEFARFGREVFLSDGRTAILPPFTPMGMTVLGQYGSAHLARDLLYYFGLATDLGVITDHEAASYLGQTGFIPGGSLGVYSAPWLIQTLTVLEMVAVAFQESCLIEQDGYQGRSTAFCTERLMGFFIQKLLSSPLPYNVVMNRPMVISFTEQIEGSAV